jgi:hypothetical protein
VKPAPRADCVNYNNACSITAVRILATCGERITETDNYCVSGYSIAKRCAFRGEQKLRFWGDQGRLVHTVHPPVTVTVTALCYSYSVMPVPLLLKAHSQVASASMRLSVANS